MPIDRCGPDGGGDERTAGRDNRGPRRSQRTLCEFCSRSTTRPFPTRPARSFSSRTICWIGSGPSEVFLGAGTQAAGYSTARRATEWVEQKSSSPSVTRNLRNSDGAVVLPSTNAKSKTGPPVRSCRTQQPECGNMGIPSFLFFAFAIHSRWRARRAAAPAEEMTRT